MKGKAALLLLLMAAAAYSVSGAYRSLHRTTAALLPEEVEARFAGRAETAAFFLREEDGRVAVFEAGRKREPLAVTAIETGKLRAADKLLLRRGIPAADSAELLELLEDLGS